MARRTKKQPPKKKKKIKATKKTRCSPGNNGRFTCYSDKSLAKLKSFWNKRHPDAPITTNDSVEIWATLKRNMGNVCKGEECWLRQNFIKQNLDSELRNYTFTPEMPEKWVSNPNEWLTSVDIEKVMKQYEKAYPNFAFIGPSPIDFDKKQSYGECIWNDLCRFNLSKYLKKGVNKIGIIFNTDPHYLEGSHWISMLVNVPEKYIFFFDSNGR